MQAFEERWAKQADAGELVNLDRLGLNNSMSLSNDGGWCAQLSRSIDSRVNAFDPSVEEPPSEKFVCDGIVQWSSVDDKDATSCKRFESATYSDITFGRCLDHKKGRLVDNSIHLTNIHHIRRAKHFIYIESQYFMGSSFMWSNDRRVKCGNMIAAEVRPLCGIRALPPKFRHLKFSSLHYLDCPQDMRKDCSKGTICSLHFVADVDGRYSSCRCNSRIVILAESDN